MEAKKQGRPTIYTEKIALEICTRIANDESLRSICESKHLPDFETVKRWLREDKFSGFRTQYAQAKSDQADFAFDELADLEARVLEGSLDYNAFRAMMDSRKWRLARMEPKKYGDRQQLEHSGPNGISLTPPVLNIKIVGNE